jgi:hypothetical protein
VQEANPRLLIFVEGVETNAIVQPTENCWWGGHVAACAKVRVPAPARLEALLSRKSRHRLTGRPAPLPTHRCAQPRRPPPLYAACTPGAALTSPPRPMFPPRRRP